MDVRSFGALCNGIADDTVAVNAAFADGRTIEFPNGRCRVRNLIIPANGTQRIQGTGSGSNCSVLVGINPSGSLISVQRGLVEIDHLRFETPSGNTLTFIDVQQHEASIHDCGMDGGMLGVRINGAINRLNNLTIRPQVISGCGVKIESGALNYLNKIDVLAPGATKCNCGIWITGTEDTQLVSCQLVGMVHGIRLDPAQNTVIASVVAQGCWMDHCSIGLYCRPITNGSIVRSSFDTCWFGSNDYGIFIQPVGFGTYEGWQFCNCQIWDNQIDGAYLDATDIQIIGGKVSGNHSVGINLGSRARRILVQGTIIGPAGGFIGNRFGIWIGSGATSYRFDATVSGNTERDLVRDNPPLNANYPEWHHLLMSSVPGEN